VLLEARCLGANTAALTERRESNLVRSGYAVGHMVGPDWNSHIGALAEAQSWCAARLDCACPTVSLRTAALRPSGYPDEWMYCEIFQDRVEALVALRRQRVPLAPPVAGAGRILCALSGLDTAMGEGTVASHGAIDGCYLPPWDTWFACIAGGDRRVLLSWIPTLLERDVQAAIDAAATEPIAWLSGPLPDRAEWKSIAGMLTHVRAALTVARGGLR